MPATHRMKIYSYNFIDKGVKMINASTWQSQTDYQKQHNFNPNPGVMPVVHLGTGKMTMMEFAKD